MQIKLVKERLGIKWKSLQKAHIKRPAQEKIDFDFYQNSDGDESSASSNDSDNDSDDGMHSGQGVHLHCISLSLPFPLPPFTPPRSGLTMYHSPLCARRPGRGDKEEDPGNESQPPKTAKRGNRAGSGLRVQGCGVRV